MKKKLNVLALILSLSMMISLLSGCNTSNKNFEIASKEELTEEKIGDTGGIKLPISNKYEKIVVLADTSIETNNDSVIVKELRRRTGLNVDIFAVPRSSIKEKARVLIASKNDMPDVMSASFTIEEINDLGMQGAFEAISDKYNILPNFKNIYVDNANENGADKVLKSLRAPDGKVYVIPTWDSQRDVNHGMLYRKDIFDKHGLTMWNGPDEFYNSMKKLKEIYPNSTPYVNKSLNVVFNYWSQSWGVNFPDPYYNETENKWKQSSTDPKFKEMLDFMKKMYDEKLIDPEFLTATQAAWTNRMTQPNSAFTTFDWIGRLDQFSQQAKAAGNNSYDLRYAYPIGPVGKVISLSKVGAGAAVKKSKNGDLAIKLLDYLLSPSGAQLMTLGIEGETYKIGSDGFAEYVGFEPDYPIQITDVEEKYGLFIPGLYKRFDRRSCYFDYSEREKEAQDMMLNKPGGGFIPEPPILSYNDEEKAVINEKATQLKTAANEFATNYILGKATGDAAWADWIKKAETLGAEDIIKVYNSAQARYDAK